MKENSPYLAWEAPEHHHTEKSNDWYWILGIIAIAGSITSVLLGNVLFGIVIILAAVAVFLISQKEPRIIAFEISSQGVQVDKTLYSYSSIESYGIDESSPIGPHLLLKSKHMFMPLIILPIPDEAVEDIEWMLRAKLTEEHLTEPFSHRLLEFFGF